MPISIISNVTFQKTNSVKVHTLLLLPLLHKVAPFVCWGQRLLLQAFIHLENKAYFWLQLIIALVFLFTLSNLFMQLRNIERKDWDLIIFGLYLPKKWGILDDLLFQDGFDIFNFLFFPEKRLLQRKDGLLILIADLINNILFYLL